MQCIGCGMDSVGREYTFFCLSNPEVNKAVESRDPTSSAIGNVGVFPFSAFVCDTCVRAKRQRYKRIVWQVLPSAYLLAAIVIAASVGSPQLIGLFVFGSIPVALVLWSLWKVLASDRRAGTVISIAKRREELVSAGYQGFFIDRPEQVTYRAGPAG